MLYATFKTQVIDREDMELSAQRLASGEGSQDHTGQCA